MPQYAIKKTVGPLALSAPPPADDKSGLVRNLIIPFGTTESENGPIELDDEAARRIMQRFAKQGVELPFDFEHASMDGLGPPPGVPVRKAGWIAELQYVPNEGIYGFVRWMDDARQLIRDGHYKYHSPTLVVERESGRVIGLDSVALTDRPAIVGGMRVAASLHKQEKRPMAEEPTTTDGGESGESLEMLFGELKQASGLEFEEGATTPVVIRAIINLLNKGKGDGEDEGDGESGDAAEDTAVANSVRTSLGLEKDAKLPEVRLAMGAKIGGGETLVAMKRELAALKKDADQRAVDDILRPHCGVTIYGPGTERTDTQKQQYDDFVAMARVNAERCKRMLKGLPKPEQGRTTAPAKPKADSREQLIANARKEFDEGGTERRLTDRTGFVNGSLLALGYKKLTDEERVQLN